eukprot:GILK01010346.1.p1 GENE.GILK01010346.1~~GILK01010346.1.p1  ORF type:complete len:132 (+),score=9.15 GILK01010346.1:34-429(+)
MDKMNVQICKLRSVASGGKINLTRGAKYTRKLLRFMFGGHEVDYLIDANGTVVQAEMREGEEYAAFHLDGPSYDVYFLPPMEEQCSDLRHGYMSPAKYGERQSWSNLLPDICTRRLVSHSSVQVAAKEKQL